MSNSPDRRTDSALFRLINESHRRIVGRALVETGRDAHWLYHNAPFAVLAHDGGEDPRFIYANAAAQAAFGYPWDEIIGMPSRLSAEAPERAERQRLLDAVSRDGFISDYRGTRITKSGKRFWIEHATVWQLVDEEGLVRGQAATFSEWRDI